MPTVDYQNRNPESTCSSLKEQEVEYGFIGTLQKLKYEYRPDITNRATLEANFREKFEALNRVRLTDSEFARLLDEITTPDVFTASKTLRSINSFTRDDGTPLNYTLVNIKDWCKNTFEVIRQLHAYTITHAIEDGNVLRFHVDYYKVVGASSSKVIKTKELEAPATVPKKAALKAILADYNARYGTNHRLGEFDLYYQDVQKRIKDQQWKSGSSFQLENPASSQARSLCYIDITIVVDMLLTGFDSKFLNTLYVDKAPVVIQKLETAVQKLDSFMKSQGLDCIPSAVANLKGDDAKAAFITHFKEVQRLKTQFDLGWKARTQSELALMDDLHPFLTKCAAGRDISGLSAYA